MIYQYEHLSQIFLGEDAESENKSCTSGTTLGFYLLNSAISTQKSIYYLTINVKLRLRLA